MDKPTLIFQAPIASRSGYGDHARDLLYSIWKLDKFNTKIVSTRWGMTPMDALSYDNPFHKWIIENIIPAIERKPDVYMQVTVPNEFQKVGKYNIGITAAIETTASPINWIHGCNTMDMVITVSEHAKMSLIGTAYDEVDNNTKQLITHHKVTKPVEILFEGYNDAVYGINANEQFFEIANIKEEFAFLFVGHWLRGDIGEDRKNVGMLIKTFAMAFKNEKVKPALILKTSSATFSVRDREAVVNAIKHSLGSDYGKVPIYLLHGDLTDEQMNTLYCSDKIKAMVSFTKGEGYGRPLLEFSLTGKPVIASNWSGHLDFLKHGAVLLDGELKNVHPSAADDFLIKEAKWFNINISSAMIKLKDIYKNYDKYKSAAQSLGIENRKKFTISKMTEKFDEILSRYSVYDVTSEPTHKPIQLPKLKKIEIPKIDK